MTPSPATTLVSGEQALAEFRRGLVPTLLRELAEHREVLVTLPVGAGKSLAADGVIQAVAGAEPDTLVAVFAPLSAILAETRARLAGLGLDPVVLTPRPKARCGPLDPEWAELERLGCAALARRDVCGRCPRRARCGWVDRWAGLAGRRLVLAAQQHLVNDPDFVPRLRAATGAAAALVVVDESDLLLRTFERRVAGPDLVRFAAAAEAAGGADGLQWAEACRALLAATEDDLLGRWDFPGVPPAWAADVAAEGRRQSCSIFRFIGYEVRQFGRSDRSTRTRLPDGGVRFAHPPDFGDRFLALSGSAAPGLVRHRLDPHHRGRAVAAPFACYHFRHPGTTWVNLADAAGTRGNFKRNAGRVLDVFARLVARNIAAGKRTLLVCRKRFRDLCKTEIRRRVRALAGAPVRVATGGWARHDLKDPRTVSLITYGVSGVNRFQHVEAAYCLTGYYVPEGAVETLVNDLVPPGHRVRVALGFKTRPPGRTAAVLDPAAAHTIAPDLARWGLEQKEADRVVQAVGRVRPFTSPREVVTFQVGTLPGVAYDHQFTTLAELRAHFGLRTPEEVRREKAAARAAAAARLKADGKTVAEIGAALGVSRATVKRLLNHTPDGGAQSAF